MHDWVADYAPTTGRILMGGYFLWSGITAALNFPDAAAQLAMVGLSSGIAAAAAVVAIEALGGMALIVSFKTRATALLLVIFTIALTTLASLAPASSATVLLYQVAIIGGLLYIAGTTKPRG